MSILVIGGNGQLGRHLRLRLPDAEFWDRCVVDLTHTAALARKLDQVRPEAIVNAAAYTAVDAAETQSGLAWCLNADVPAILARAAQRLDIPLVQVSTDYVFNGEKHDGYSESDPVWPLNQYGRSKLGGELAVSALSTRHWILRTSWVFSEHGRNFVKTVLRLARERSELRIVEDQRGHPTYAGDLAACIQSVLGAVGRHDELPYGTHHVGGGPAVSWMEFATQVLEAAVAHGVLHRLPRVIGIPASAYPAPAARPRNSVLLTRDATAAFTREPFDWRRGLMTTVVASA